jgi:hypothetical protein
MLSYRHTSSVSSGNTAGAGTQSVGNGSNEIMFKGSLGVDGLSVLVGKNTIEATQPNTVDGTGKSIGIAYNMGQITVGAAKKDYEDTNTTASAQSEFNTKEYGIGYAVNDNMSLALNYIVTDGDNATTAFAAKEKIRGIGIGYNLGGIALEISYAEAENVAGTNGADGEELQIRTVQKF